jgi:hypothetical protein
MWAATHWHYPWEARQSRPCTRSGRSSLLWGIPRMTRPSCCMLRKCSSGDARLVEISMPHRVEQSRRCATHGLRGICRPMCQPLIACPPCRVFGGRTASILRHRPSCLTWRRLLPRILSCTLQYRPRLSISLETRHGTEAREQESSDWVVGEGQHTMSTSTGAIMTVS